MFAVCFSAFYLKIIVLKWNYFWYSLRNCKGKKVSYVYVTNFNSNSVQNTTNCYRQRYHSSPTGLAPPPGTCLFSQHSYHPVGLWAKTHTCCMSWETRDGFKRWGKAYIFVHSGLDQVIGGPPLPPSGVTWVGLPRGSISHRSCFLITFLGAVKFRSRDTVSGGRAASCCPSWFMMIVQF